MKTEEEFKTVNKHFMFFEKDIEVMQRNGWTPKEMLRLGIIARQENPGMLLRLNKAEQRLDHYKHRLTALSEAVFNLNHELKKLKEDNNLK